MKMDCDYYRQLMTIITCRLTFSHALILSNTVVDAFIANGARYNLRNSVVIEMVEFVWTKDVKLLVDYLVTNHFEDKFSDISYVTTFRLLKLRWEDNQVRARSTCFGVKLA